MVCVEKKTGLTDIKPGRRDRTGLKGTEISSGSKANRMRGEPRSRGVAERYGGLRCYEVEARPWAL